MLVQAAQRPFSRGVHDCTQLAIQSEIACLGATRFPEFDRTYKTAKRGYMIIKRLGFDSMFETASSRMIEIDPADAKRGDVIGHISDEGEALGVCAGANGFYAANAPSGIIIRPTDEIVKAWTV